MGRIPVIFAFLLITTIPVFLLKSHPSPALVMALSLLGLARWPRNEYRRWQVPQTGPIRVPIDRTGH